MGAGIFYLATRDVRQGAKLAKDGAAQFRKNVKTMQEWAEEAAAGCAPASFLLPIHYQFNGNPHI